MERAVSNEWNTAPWGESKRKGEASKIEERVKRFQGQEGRCDFMEVMGLVTE